MIKVSLFRFLFLCCNKIQLNRNGDSCVDVGTVRKNLETTQQGTIKLMWKSKHK